MKKQLIVLLSVCWLLLPKLALAHDGPHTPSSIDGFLYGFFHPILGFDHLLAMICVGVLSAQLGGRAIWQVPAAFVATLALGSFLSLLAIPLPGVELAIAFSVLALGGAVLADKQLPLAVTLLIISLFGLFHGHAHGAEIPSQVQPLHFVGGFSLASTLIHLLGVWLGGVMTRGKRRVFVLRAAGALVVLIGVTFLAGV